LPGESPGKQGFLSSVQSLRSLLREERRRLRAAWQPLQRVFLRQCASVLRPAPDVQKRRYHRRSCESRRSRR